MKYTELPDEFPSAEAFQILRDAYLSKTVDNEKAFICGLNVLGYAGHLYLSRSEPAPLRSAGASPAAIMAAWDQACSEGMKAGGAFLPILLPIILSIVQKLILKS